LGKRLRRKHDLLAMEWLHRNLAVRFPLKVEQVVIDVLMAKKRVAWREIAALRRS
jgi:hypothetical protein